MRHFYILLALLLVAVDGFSQGTTTPPAGAGAPRGRRNAGQTSATQTGGARRGGGRGQRGAAATYPAPVEGDYVIKDFKFHSGQTMPELRLHYRTIGTLKTDAAGHATNAVYIMHGTTGNGTNFTVPGFAGELFGPGQLLDATKYFIVLPDGIGHGKSSKPSDGLHAKFPNYGYTDMVNADHQMLVEGLHVDHLRLEMGTSMGGMQAWLWGEMYPDFEDALMPLASAPTQVSARNRMWRKLIIDSIRNDPDWKGGDYTEQPRRAMETITVLMDFMGGNPITHYRQHPTLESVDRAIAGRIDSGARTMDANDVLYAYAASEDFVPENDLEKIKAPLYAVNSADDLINPPELQILENGIKRVPKGKCVVIPLSDQTVGHGSHTKAVLWKQYLEELLKESAH